MSDRSAFPRRPEGRGLHAPGARWKGLADRGVTRKIWLSQRGHVDPFDTRREKWVATLHKWFDHELHKIRNDALREPRADIETGPDQWITQRDWPTPGTRNLTLRPGADGSLGPRPARGTAAYTDSPGPQGDGHSEADLVSDPTAAKPYRLAYVSGPVPRTARISGTPSARLKVKLDRPTANLTALLVDYGQDTRVDYLGRGEGIETLATESCHGQSIPADDACYRQTRTKTVSSPVNVIGRGWLDAQNHASLSDPRPLEPGKYHHVRWETLSQEYVLKKGHRLALIVAGTDSDYTTETPTGARVTVDLAGSSVRVPIIVTDGSDVSTFVEPQPRGTWRGPSDVVLPRQPRNFH